MSLSEAVSARTDVVPMLFHLLSFLLCFFPSNFCTVESHWTFSTTFLTSSKVAHVT